LKTQVPLVLAFQVLPITDNGLRYLKVLSKLKQLFLFETQVTEAGSDDLKAANPSLVLGWVDWKALFDPLRKPPLKSKR
jgi:hypothetical protein